jgi:hypothetical protein
MTSRALYARPQQTLINALSQRSPHAVSPSQQLLYEIFPGLYRGEYFHCASFFRSDHLPERHYEAHQKFYFRDGRIYQIIELRLERVDHPEVRYRCCMDVIEEHNGEFLPFEVWFYRSAFEEGRFEEQDETALLRYTRHRIWEFLYTKRDAVPWSRYGHPYICECR